MTFEVGYEIEGIIGHMIEFLDGGVQGAHSAEIPLYYGFSTKIIKCSFAWAASLPFGYSYPELRAAHQ